MGLQGQVEHEEVLGHSGVVLDAEGHCVVGMPVAGVHEGLHLMLNCQHLVLCRSLVC